VVGGLPSPFQADCSGRAVLAFLAMGSASSEAFRLASYKKGRDKSAQESGGKEKRLNELEVAASAAGAAIFSSSSSEESSDEVSESEESEEDSV
jgi:hypothetical protein